MNEHIKHKFKKYKKVKPCYEYALFFNNSNDMIDFVCRAKFQSIISSRLYTYRGTYQLLITSDSPFNKMAENIIFYDKMHIDEIKFKNHLICKNNALLKLQKAFKAI